eukprot:4184943-Prymnesium_polylepis.1
MRKPRLATSRSSSRRTASGGAVADERSTPTTRAPNGSSGSRRKAALIRSTGVPGPGAHGRATRAT